MASYVYSTTFLTTTVKASPTKTIYATYPTPLVLDDKVDSPSTTRSTYNEMRMRNKESWSLSTGSIVLICVMALLAMISTYLVILGCRRKIYHKRSRYDYQLTRMERINGALPRLNYQRWKKEKDRQNDQEEDRDNCTICLEDIQDDQSVRRLPCPHVYHKACLDRWLLNHSHWKCPLCPTRLIPRAVLRPRRTTDGLDGLDGLYGLHGFELWRYSGRS